APLPAHTEPGPTPPDAAASRYPAATLPARRPDLVIRPLGDRGRYVVKDPRSGAFFTFGEQEHFLLTQLDGKRDAEAICKAFEERFDEPLSEEDLGGFLKLARGKGLLQPAGPTVPQAEAGPPPAVAAAGPPRPARPRQSILYWRKNIFDPDRLFTWLAPQIAFIWTRTFLLASAACIVLAATLVWANRQDLVSSFAHAWRWETALLVWLTLILA